MKRTLAVVLAAFLLSGHLFAQSTNATLGGTASDTSGALIPGVTITSTNTGTGIVSTILSNESGTYQFASLQPGTYRVSAELPGFQTQVYNDVTLGLSQQVRLNFTLQVSLAAQTVEVTSAADTLIATTSASVGSVLPDYKVRDLPLGNRNVLDLVGTTAGVRGSSFAGAPSGMTITTRDGISVQDGRYDNGVFSATTVSPDLVEEVRVIVGPADAEMGRGAGQVQMVTRSGTNQFRGSVFWVNRNSALDANTFANNYNGISKNYFNRNQYGARFGGPLIRNKTFFFFLYEGQRFVEKTPVTTTVLTQTARQGNYRFFPGVQSANASANTPTVNQAGDPVTPPGAMGPLQTFNVFAQDPYRRGFDPSGWIAMILPRMPLPNDFNSGDGLNTAGHRWVRRSIGTESNNGAGTDLNRDQVNLRLDHHFNASHKLNMVGSREQTETTTAPPAWPGGYFGRSIRGPHIYTLSLVSTLSPTMLNEARVGLRRGKSYQPQAYDVEGQADEVKKFMGDYKGMPYIIKPTLFENNLFNDSNGKIGTRTPMWVYGDTLSWTKGKHALKFGAEIRRAFNNTFGTDEIIPKINLGPSSSTRQYFQTSANQYGVPIQGISSVNLPGLSSNDAQRARDLLADLSGSVAQISEAFNLRQDPKNLEYLDYSQMYVKERETHTNEFTAFYKDDWKVHPKLTVNLGLRWEWYGVPYATKSLIGAPVGGGTAGVFGISGTSWSDWYRPGASNGSLTQIEFVGKNAPNPDSQLHNDDWNNFAPAFGLSWSLPWWGEDKTVLRMGYGVGYQGPGTSGRGITWDTSVANMPGMHQFASHPITLETTGYVNLTNIVVPIPERYPPLGTRLPTVPLTARNETLNAFDTNLRNPYVQTFNVELQREILPNLTMEVRYLGTKGSKLYGSVAINTPMTVENGILDAFLTTVRGGSAPLFDQMLRTLNLGLGPVNGTTVTGSASLRQNAGTRTFLANGNPGGLANFLNGTTNFTGVAGGILRNGGLPENFIVTNPQFAVATLNGNPGNSTYHSLNISVTKRLSQGFTNQTTYTWSRTLGTGTIVDPRVRGVKALSGQHRTHDLRSNGTWELPFGPNRPLLGNAPAIIQRFVERWQFGAIFNINSGAPLTLTASASPFLNGGTNYPDMVGDIPKDFGRVNITNTPGVITYFEGMGQITDPGIAGVTTLQTLSSAFSNRAITDAQGRLLLVNPAVGTIGNMGPAWLEGPGSIGLDANLIKRVRISETKEFEFRLDAVNVLNHPNFGNPTTSINSVNFGRISLPNSGNREFSMNLRVNF
jgi:hypothetical protein